MPAAPTIGLFISSSQDVYESAILRGVFDACREQGANVICFTSGALRSYHGFEAQRNVLYDMIQPGDLDGLIICGTLAHPVSRDEMVAFCQRYSEIALVGIALAIPGIPNVMVDNRQGIREVMEHLIVEHGYRRLAFLRGPRGQQEADERYQAYLEALADHALPFQPELVADGDYTFASGAYAMRELLLMSALDGAGLAFDALVAANDSMALGALEVLLQAGIAVPEQVALTGFDDTLAGRFAASPLTSIRQSAYDQGRQAASLLLEELAGGEKPAEGAALAAQIIAPAHMVVRRSCGCSGLRLSPAPVADLCPSENWRSGLAHCYPAVVTAMQEIMSYVTPEQVAAWANSWQVALTSDLELILAGYDEPAPGRQAFSAILRGSALARAVEAAYRQGERLEIELAAWNRALAVFARYTQRCLSAAAPGRLEILEDSRRLFEAAQRLLGEAAANYEARRQIEIEQRMVTLREFSETLMTAFDLPRLYEALHWELPRMEVSSCFISLFEDPQNPAGLARLIFAQRATERLLLPPEGLVFYSQQLLPQEIWDGMAAFGLVVEVLYSKEARLGFVVLEVAPERASICNSLRATLSSALQGVLLLEQRRKAEEELRRSQAELEMLVDQLEEANRELEAFAYSVSHDLRAPLRSIVGYSSILQEDYNTALPPDAQGLLDKVIESGQRMGALIDALLSFSRLGRAELHIQSVDMNALVAQACESLLDETRDRQVAWVLHELPPAQADPALIRQVLVNLIGNAIKYTCRTPQALIEVGCRLESGLPVYFVRDNGAGFDMRYVDKLFRVFQRLHHQDEYEGTGIGLATVARIVNRHGGRVWAEAAIGQGATFYFALPG